MTNVELIEADQEYSRYRTDYGDLRVRDVALTKGELPQCLPVGELWNAFELAVREVIYPAIPQEPLFPEHPPLADTTEDQRRQLFLDYLQALGIVSMIYEIGFCPSCDRPDWDDELTADTVDGYCCDSCGSDKYRECPRCDQLLRKDELERNGQYDLSGELVCASCIEDNYSFCAECDGYYHEDDSDEHDHEDKEDDGMCCDSPLPEFKVRNGDGTLANDTRLEVALPSRISREGLTKIRALFVAQGGGGFRDLAYYLMDELAAEWQTRTGNYTRRLSKLAYDMLGLKIPPAVLSEVGTIARDHSKAATLDIEVTRRLNMSSSDFYHDGSCWWGSYSESRCALKTNGGLGMRSFNNGCVSGRAWVMPLRRIGGKQLIPTFNAESPDAFIVFNGYGDLGSYTPARIMAQLAGWTYAKVEFTCEPMYINSGGYLVAPEEIVRDVKGLRLNLRQHSDLFADEMRRELTHVA